MVQVPLLGTGNAVNLLEKPAAGHRTCRVPPSLCASEMAHVMFCELHLKVGRTTKAVAIPAMLGRGGGHVDPGPHSLSSPKPWPSGPLPLPWGPRPGMFPRPWRISGGILASAAGEPGSSANTRQTDSLALSATPTPRATAGQATAESSHLGGRWRLPVS